MGVDAVRDSRAGDIFHYRWAARRCLRLVNPNLKVTRIVIEGSSEPTLAGEYVMDVTEYSEAEDGLRKNISYYQLKHTSKRVDQCFKLSELKKTIQGFANRYKEHLKNPSDELGIITFSIITNRKLCNTFKDGITSIAKNLDSDRKFHNKFKEYTGLKDQNLQRFCEAFKWIDDEGNFADQKKELHFEMAAFFSGIVEHDEINNIIDLVQKQVLPDASGAITPEKVLMCLGGFTDRNQLFPAPPKFEPINNPIKREQHDELLGKIVKSSDPIIIHASGGVGKSIICRMLINELPTGSVGIVYDCFGGGEYLNRIKSRHRYRDALIQIANELAVLDLCEPLILRSTDSDDQLLRAFLNRLETAGKKVKQVNPDSLVTIFIDAADNAAMAANDFNEKDFITQLLKQNFHNSCRIIALCRTERINLLAPKKNVQQINLLPFSQGESLVHLRKYFSNARENDGLEFHRLTSGNPRVQANAVNFNPLSLSKVLTDLGPGYSVDKQIATQIETAIEQLKEKHPTIFQQQINDICIGLANLHPLIPIDVLAVAAKVDIGTIKSFIADLGRPFLLSDQSVQFRDEPTESWFKQQFSASPILINDYINRLKPLAKTFNYVAEVLPILLLRSENYSELIGLALSDELLPESPIDKRNVRISRLQYAFKAALKVQNYADATKLALRAGEEMAGDQRHLDLLSKNIDLIAPLQSQQRVQELAFRRMLNGGNWQGSENVYSAALLSSLNDFKGEAQNYLRSAEEWLKIYFDEKTNDNSNTFNVSINDEDIVELAFTHLNLFGSQKCVEFITNWEPKTVGFRITRLLINRLIDAMQFATIDEIAKFSSKNLYLILAIADGLIVVGKYPPADVLEISLKLLSESPTQLTLGEYDYYTNGSSLHVAIISFAEACLASGLSTSTIQSVVVHYFTARATYPFYNDYGVTKQHNLFMRRTALTAVISGDLQPDIKTIMPIEFLNSPNKFQSDLNRFQMVIDSLLPWFILRTQLLAKCVDYDNILTQSITLSSKFGFNYRYHNYDRLPSDLALIRFECLVFNPAEKETTIKNFIPILSDKNLNFSTDEIFNALRTACILKHLSYLRYPLENFFRNSITSNKAEGPEWLAESYIQLARAVRPINLENAKAYFDEAIEVVSKFGDELVERWEALVALANRSSSSGNSSPETAYRFIRCAELVGNTVVKERYWNRYEAIETCFNLHPNSAFAALSRWRDRNIGLLDKQFSALIKIALKSKKITAAMCWSLTVFSENDDLEKLDTLCIEFETDNCRRQLILDHAVRNLRINDSPKVHYQTLARLAKQYSLENRELDEALAFYKVSAEPTTQTLISTNNNKNNEDPSDYDLLFAELDLTSSLGLNDAIDRFKGIPGPRYHENFWQELFNRVPENTASKILNYIIEAESADFTDVLRGLKAFPSCWLEHFSVQKIWPKIFEKLGSRFSNLSSNERKYFLKNIKPTKQHIELFNKGTLEGLAKYNNQADVSTLFGFCDVASTHISHEQAADILDYGLNRLEEHIDMQYADGPWGSWLIPPESISEAITGFIWSALGSPRSEERWQAVHSVRRLAETDCNAEIDSLINWMDKDNVAAFGSNKYTFYKLHAQQYLLIAISRAAIDKPEIFIKHHAFFSKYALHTISHVLIQKYAKDIALRLELAFPNTYTRDVIFSLQKIGVSQFEFRSVNDYHNNFVSTRHQHSEIDKTLTFDFPFDFDKYWFEPLGYVFGINSQQVEELAREIVINCFDIPSEWAYHKDARHSLWQSDQDIWQSRSDYPKVDTYHFYLSYHAMLMVASSLLETMPIVQRNDYFIDEWKEWLQKHLLTRSDNRWLADRRDPPPLLRRNWLQIHQSESWQWEIVSDDFLEGLFKEHAGKTWINASGSWSDNVDELVEVFSIASAFIEPQTSLSLLNALTTCSNPYSYKIPDYNEEDNLLNTPPFQLEGWLYSEYQVNGLDKYDPFAGSIRFPPIRPAKYIVEQFKLTTDHDQRNWTQQNSSIPVLFSEIWGDRPSNHIDSPVRHGKRISISLDFLKHICSVLKRDLIIEVKIRRYYAHNSYRRKTNDTLEPQLPYSKIYLFSADGKLRDTTKSYCLG